MDNQETLSLGVVLERRRVDHPWQDTAWAPVAVVPGAAAGDPAGAWTLLRRGEGWARYLAGTLPLELFRRETEGYKLNLSHDPPRIFVVLREDDDGASDHEFIPFLVTACPYEAQDYLDSSEEIVEGVPMPTDVIAFVQAFVDHHHVDEPFKKRKRKRYDPDQAGFGRRATAGERGKGNG